MTEREPAARSATAKGILRWARVAVAILLVAFLAWRAGIGDLATVTKSLRPGWALAALALVPVSILIRAFNHSLLLNRDGRVIGLVDMTRLTLVGAGINLFIPMGAADLAKAHYGYRLHGHPERMIVSSVLDKITSLTAVGLLGLVGSIVAREPLMGVLAAAVGLASLVPFVAPGIMPWRWLIRVLAPRAEIAEDSLREAARAPLGRLLAVWAVSVAGWLVTYSIVYLCCLAVGADIGPAYVLALAPFATLARLVPISVGGIGLGEVTMVALLMRAGVPRDLAALAALLQLALAVLLPGAAGALLLAAGRPRST